MHFRYSLPQVWAHLRPRPVLLKPEPLNLINMSKNEGRMARHF
jgi:hypothetical protein